MLSSDIHRFWCYTLNLSNFDIVLSFYVLLKFRRWSIVVLVDILVNIESTFELRDVTKPHKRPG